MKHTTLKQIAFVLALALACVITYLYPYTSSTIADMALANFCLTALYTFLIWVAGGFVLLLCTMGGDKQEYKEWEETRIITGYLGNRVWTVLTKHDGVRDMELKNIRYEESDTDEAVLVYRYRTSRTVVKPGLFNLLAHGESTDWNERNVYRDVVRIELPSDQYFEIVENID